MNETHDLVRRNSNSATTQQQTGKSISGVGGDGLLLRRTMDCLPLTHGVGTHHPHLMASSNTVNVTVAPSSAVVAAYPHHHHLNLNHHHLLSHHLPYSNNYSGLHHTSTTSTNMSHHHNHPHLNIHSEQTKSLQELQHEVGALLEFRDLVIETFPDLKQKMASISSAASTSSSTGGAGGGSGNVMTNGQSSSVSVSSSGSIIPLTSGGTLVSRREWEPGIRVKRKISQKEQPAAIELTSSSSLTRSRSNSHSGKKEPKSSSGGGVSGSGVSGGATSGGENNNGSVVQDSGFSTETSSSKEGHSASSTNGALTGAIASNRLSCPESDDELLNLLDVIHRKSNRLREEVEHLQNYERQHLQPSSSAERDQTDVATTSAEGATGLSKSSSSSANTALTPKTFREHVERLNKEDLQQLRKERDRLLDKLAEMEAETLTGRIKAAKMSEKVEELINVKRDLEEQLKLAMAQRLELNSRVQQLQQQQQLTHSKSSNSQSDFSSSPRTFLSSSANTVLSTVSANSSRQHTFQPVVVEQQTTDQQQHNHLIPFHQSTGSDNKRNSQLQQFTPDQLGRLDGIVSTPGDRNTKCRVTDSKRFAAILLETSVIELRRHLLTLTVKNQVLMQKLDQASKTKGHLVKRLDKSKEDVDDLRFQLEEKNIELEGTKAQLRVLESRLHSITPSSGAATNSYLHSQNDYETNRSSASTTLMLSRRGGAGSGLNTDSSDIRSSTPISATHNGQMPQPITMQISTPSMKAMTHLAMDDMQHHSSSTESAHEHDLVHHDTMTISQMQTKLENGRNIRQALMSTSVDGVSPFEQQLQQQHVAAIRNQVQALKKFSGVTTTKPSKIPLPGSKAAAYFAGKPPSGRPSTAGRSPPSANSSGSSSRSPLSRSTGNLLYSKSPNSLKRADSAQSIRKDNNSSSLSTNTSRSSTSSSIPMATTSYGSASKSYVGGAGGGGGSINNTTSNNTLNSPSSRVLQNSPLPKPKRESLSTKVRHMDSLSRAYHHQQQHNNTNTTHNYSNVSNTSDNTPTTIVQTNTLSTTATTPGGGTGAGSYLISSTPKTSTIAAQLTSSLRKDLQLSSSSFNHPAPFQRRATASSAGQTNANTNTISTTTHTTRRFSSASVMGARAARQANQDYEGQHNSNVSGNSVAAGVTSSSSSTHSGGVNNGGTASDSDSGKNFSYDKNCANNAKEMKSGLNQYFEEVLPTITVTLPKTNNKLKVAKTNSNKITLSQYFERELLEETTAAERMQEMSELQDSIDGTYVEETNNDDEEIDIYTSYASYMSSSDPGSDNLLVTFDYGYQDSLEADLSLNSQKLEILDSNEQLNKNLFKIPEEESSEDLLKPKHAEMYSKSPNIFKVHQVKHAESNSSNLNITTRASSYISMAPSMVEYNADTSGDYGSWAQCESEQEEGNIDEKTYGNYRYEDLIKNEVLIHDDDVDNDNIINDGMEGREVLINFDFDEDVPPRWFNNNEQLYYRSVDYLN
ncbi:serine-rich adhesin for platelets isoform X2 [Calliphora vicina]|uniref:serine-rich adhesin for platelets isoform X2 n=1 Tax=Calliphora vicina TaxID=7373 RepID=UPI00325A9F2A